MANYYAGQALIDGATRATRAAEPNERKNPPPLSDAQVALNLQDRGWCAADVVFVKDLADVAETVRTGQRRTYKTSDLSVGCGSCIGRLAHVDVKGELRPVVIVDIRKPTAKDILRAHRRLIYTNLEAYQAAVDRDADILAQIEAKIQGNREITELAKTVDRLKADGVAGL
jgi:hypothetical protein